MTRQEQKKSRQFKFPKYYLIGLVVMLIGLIVSFEVSEAFGLIILVIGFGLGITGRIYSRKESAKFSITDNLEPSEDKSKKTEEVVSEHPVNMIRCKNCGTTFQDSYIKCPNCGAGHS